MQNLKDVKSPYSFAFQVQRFVWTVAQKILFQLSPNIFFAWRNFVLRCFGARIGRAAKIHRTADIFWPGNLSIGDYSAIGPKVEIYNLGLIQLEDNVVVSQHTYLCSGSHDIASREFKLTTAPIVIESGAWIAAKAFIGPGVRIGKMAVVGAASVVVKDVPEATIVAGNPAKQIGVRTFREGPADEVAADGLGQLKPAKGGAETSAGS
jgi:putative colanic acid biosynthesis acetyltransferase WcaF